MKLALSLVLLSFSGFFSAFGDPLELFKGLTIEDNDPDSTFQELDVGPGMFYCFWDGDDLLGFTMSSFEAYDGNIKAYIKGQEIGLKNADAKKIRVKKRPDLTNSNGDAVYSYLISCVLQDTAIQQCLYSLPTENGFLNMVVLPNGEHDLSEFQKRADTVMSTAVASAIE